MSAAVRRSVAMILVGLVAGVVLMMVWPASAHHRRSNARLTRRINALEYRVEFCITPLGVGFFGRPDEGEGYVYRAGGSEFLVSGLDLVTDGPAPLYMATIRPECVDTGRRSSQRGFDLDGAPSSQRRM